MRAFYLCSPFVQAYGSLGICFLEGGWAVQPTLELCNITTCCGCHNYTWPVGRTVGYLFSKLDYLMVRYIRGKEKTIAVYLLII